MTYKTKTIIFFMIFTLAFGLYDPSFSHASLPSGVVQVASVAGASVSVSGVSAVIPASATAGIPSVGTATAAGVSTPVLVPLTVAGVALAGGYCIGASLMTDIPALQDLALAMPDKYAALKAALTPSSSSSSSLPIPTTGDIVSTPSGTFQLGPLYQTFTDVVNLGEHDGSMIYNPPFVQYYQATGDHVFTVYRYLADYTTSAPTFPTTPTAPSPLTPEQAAANMSNPDGTLKPDVDADIDAAIANGDLHPSISVSPGQVDPARTGRTPC